MTTIHHEVLAACPPQHVWALLADLEAVQRYNPGVRLAAIEGANPAARLFLQSPAAVGLSLAARAGLAPHGGERDPHPLVRHRRSGERTSGARSGAGLAAIGLSLVWAVARMVSAC